jgi:molybdopterin/thiamine biosynthesis adenylyltransferase
MFKQEYITRHRDLINPEAYNKKIVVVGAGAIGSFVVLALAKMGFQNIHVYDFDTVENENISSQFYSTQSIGMHKAPALFEMVKAFTGISINFHVAKIMDSDTLEGDIVISAVDSMAVRRMILNISNTYWLIDPRMGAEYATMEVVDAQNEKSREDYKRSLFSDSEAVQERCTAKTTIYTVLLIAGQVVKAVKDITSFSDAKDGSYVQRDPITNLDWNIRDNALLAFSNGRKL